MPVKTIAVAANQRWNNTGVHLDANATAHVRYLSGRWVTNPDKHIDTDGNGFNENAQDDDGSSLGGHRISLLVAMIKNDQWATRGPIGNDGTISAGHDGILYLGANDNDFSDNTGHLMVEITYP